MGGGGVADDDLLALRTDQRGDQAAEALARARAGRGSVLLLEDIGERPYRLDRMLTQLRLSGLLDGVVGIAVGTLTQCEEKDASYTAMEVMGELLAELKNYRRGLDGIVERLVRGEFADTASANKALEPIKAPVRAMDKSLADMTDTVNRHSAAVVAELEQQLVDHYSEASRFCTLINDRDKTVYFALRVECASPTRLGLVQSRLHVGGEGDHREASNAAADGQGDSEPDVWVVGPPAEGVGC